MQSPDAREGLNNLALAELSPSEALDVVRSLINSPGTKAQAVHDALRSAAWKLLTNRVFDESMREWQGVFRRAAALFSAVGEHKMAERARLMGELAVESARFGKLHEIDQVLSRLHVQQILRFLLQNGGQAPRKDVREYVQIKQANLSRILSTVLVPVGLVERHRRGAEFDLELTALAKNLLGRQMRRQSGAGSLELEPPFEARASKSHAAAR